MINYEFNNELGILEVKYEGKVSIEEMMDYGKQITDNQELPRELRTLTDVTNAEYYIKVDDVPEIIESLKKTLEKYDFIRAAFMQSKPKETALSMLVEKRSNIKNYYHNVFTTREAAIEWLLK